MPNEPHVRECNIGAAFAIISLIVDPRDIKVNGGSKV